MNWTKRIGLAAAIAVACVLGPSMTGVTAAPEPEDFPGAHSATGTVFVDANGNGTLDAGEGGMAGVRVTAARQAVVTDAEGKYALSPAEPFNTVSVSFPSGTWPTGPWFRRMYKDQEAGVDFGLRQESWTYPFLFVQITDTHEAYNTWTAIRKECESLPLAPKFYVFTGDLGNGDPSVHDMPKLHEMFSREGENYRNFGAPFFMVQGNHDTVGYGGAGREVITPEAARQPFFANGCWERYVGPSYWSFSYGNVHFMGIEYCIWEGNWPASPKATAAWMKDDLKSVEPGTRTVLCVHEPVKAASWVGMYGMDLGLCGHSHQVGHEQYGGGTGRLVPLPENVLMSGTSQRGYRIVVVEKDRMDTFYKPLGEERPVVLDFDPVLTSWRDLGKAPPIGTLEVRGQVFDPEGRLSQVKVSIGGRETDATVTRRRLWADFTARVEIKAAAEYETLTVTGVFPDGVRTAAPARGGRRG